MGRRRTVQGGVVGEQRDWGGWRRHTEVNSQTNEMEGRAGGHETARLWGLKTGW